ncbi:hypothetical protein FV228_01750 [Methylobacterium sp. WL18]|nr:hypothetical protein FV228_01750 [Methylobacterium sp. WL18]
MLRHAVEDDQEGPLRDVGGKVGKVSVPEGGLDLDEVIPEPGARGHEYEAVVGPCRDEAGRIVRVLVGPKHRVAPLLHHEAAELDGAGVVAGVVRQG